MRWRRTALCTTRASSPRSAVIAGPSGRAQGATGSGIEIAEVPSEVHGAFIRESPVDVRPRGAGPGAPDTRITGAALYSSVTRRHASTISRCAAPYSSPRDRRHGRVGLELPRAASALSVGDGQ